MAVSIGSKILMPEGITLREGVEIRLTFQVDLINHLHRDFGLVIELWAQGVMGAELIIGGTVHDIPLFDNMALMALSVAQSESTGKMFDAVLIAAADWYSRNYEFTLRRKAAGTDDDHVVFEMREKDKPDGEVFATEPFHREWLDKYFVIL